MSGPVLRLTQPLLHPDQLTVESGLAAGLSWALLACWCWLVLNAVAVAGEAAVTGRVRHSRTSGLARRLVAAACGVTLAAGVAPSYADTRAPLPHTVSLLDGLPLPDRVTGARDDQQPTTSIVVRRGDTLSALAHAHSLEWPDLYRANRHRIGADPDLILPGTHLAVPSPEGNPS